MEGEKAETCAFFKGYLTDEEVQILSILRGLKEKAREVRREMRRLHQELDVELFARPEEDLTPSERRRRRAQEALHRQWRECARQLDELRQQWREWEQMRWEAHHRKMVLLGHRPWGSRPEIP
jgi:aldehyde:ferredoxin oxidoreductase